MPQAAHALASEELNKFTETQEESFENDFNDLDESESMLEREHDLRDDLHTHQKLKSTFSGQITSLENSFAQTVFHTTQEMSVDMLGLVHNGFIASAAEYAAIAAINEENLVIIAAKSKFLAPAKSGDIIDFKAKAKFEDSRKREVNVTGEIGEIKIFEGIFQAVVLEKHILKTKLKNINTDYHARLG
ncbi:hotdog domain-containing protein [Sulfurospirillum sp. 1612]|uniref:hotdog domain-containing protein n=1 Tax=Sulfurospirillum sp. 1612 TaxID=3094835 RepID=UPI002F9355D1